MPPEVIFAVLAAAMVHAGWNAIAKSAGHGDPLVATSAIAIGGGLTALPMLLISGLPGPASYPHVIASGVVHVVYFILVGLAYRAADYSAVYPITRGSAPLATSMLAAVFLGEALTPPAWGGVVLLSIGVLGLGANATAKGGLTRRALGVAGMNVAVIVGYTLLDGAGTRASGNPAGYVLAMMALTGLFLLPVILVWMGRQVVKGLMAHALIGVGGGTMVSFSYGVALWAMTKAPIGAVAALRETSVLFATAIAAVFLREKFGAWRWICAGVIVTGLAALRLG